MAARVKNAMRIEHESSGVQCTQVLWVLGPVCAASRASLGDSLSAAGSCRRRRAARAVAEGSLGAY